MYQGMMFGMMAAQGSGGAKAAEVPKADAATKAGSDPASIAAAA